MRVEGLEHVNIVAADIGRTVEFYEKVLGLEAREIPVAPPGYPGRWIYDEQDRAILHVQVTILIVTARWAKRVPRPGRSTMSRSPAPILPRCGVAATRWGWNTGSAMCPAEASNRYS